MKQLTTITLTFKLSHKSDESDIQSVRNLINKLRDYNDDGEVEVITDEETDYHTFVKHDGKYSQQFGFRDIDSFVTKYAKYAKNGARDIASVLRDYGTFVECDSETEEVGDGEQQ